MKHIEEHTLLNIHGTDTPEPTTPLCRRGEVAHQSLLAHRTQTGFNSRDRGQE